jgi:hypothetical protein
MTVIAARVKPSRVSRLIELRAEQRSSAASQYSVMYGAEFSLEGVRIEALWLRAPVETPQATD